MAFDEVNFPSEIIAFGSEGGPGHATEIIETDSGQEERVTRWPYPRHHFRVNLVARSNAEIAAIRTFAIARQGATRGFRLKDHNDFTTNLDGTGAAADNDVQIGVGDGSQTTFQLIKKYTSGMSTITRKIVKPVSALTLIAVDGVAKSDPGDFTVDTTTGLVTFGAAPADTLPVTSGLDGFDVPVRFSEGVDQLLASVREDVDENRVDSLEMVELLDPVPVNMDRPYLGGIERVTSGNFTVSLLEAHTYVVDMQASGLAVLLPDPATLPTGGDLWSIINGGANSFAIKDHLGATLIAALATNEAVNIHLSDDGAGGFVWYAF